jgi:hypothetical protein
MNSNDIEILLKIKKLNEKNIFLFNNLLCEIENQDTYKSLTYTYYEHYEKVNDLLNKKILECCPHNFIEDYIDISPEVSQKITYCSICENNRDDCNVKK